MNAVTGSSGALPLLLLVLLASLQGSSGVEHAAEESLLPFDCLTFQSPTFQSP
jgi:hypothetical protein